MSENHAHDASFSVLSFEIGINTTHTLSDPICEHLLAAGACSVGEVRQHNLRVYEVVCDTIRSDALIGILRGYGFDPETRALRADYHDAWIDAEVGNEFTIAGHRIIVCTPEKIPADIDADTICIDPRGSFGFGSHPTSILLAEMLQSDEVKDLAHQGAVKCLDFGCGSGILSILAEKTGFDHIMAIDIEKTAVESTKLNISLNNCHKIEALQSFPVDKELSGYFGLIMANVPGDVHHKSAAFLSQALADRGLIMLSGFGEERFSEMVHLYHDNCCTELLRKTTDGWGALLLQKLK